MTPVDLLPIPPEAHVPLWELDRSLYGRGTEAAAIAEAVARPVLTAWVEEIAAEWDDQRWSTTPRAMAKVLRDRLAELAEERQ